MLNQISSVSGLDCDFGFCYLLDFSVDADVVFVCSLSVDTVLGGFAVSTERERC